MRLLRGWPRGLAAVVAVGILAPVGLGMAWLVSRAVESPLRADASPTPLVVTVGSAVRDAPMAVRLSVEHTEPFQVIAAGSGVVTDVHVRAGDEVAAGDPVVSVDDQERLALTADAPLWRDIGFGVKGDDVARVQEFLDALDLPTGSVPGTATEATTEGFRQFNQLLGRGGDDRIFHRETVLWVGAEPMVVDEVVVRVGEAVSDAMPVLLGPTRAVSVLVEEPEAAAQPDAEHVLAIGEVVVPYTVGSGRIDDPESVTAVAAVARGEEAVGTVLLAEPVEVATMPVSAIVTDADGRTCVFEDASGDPMPVETIGGTLSAAEVPLEWAGRQVLANPREVREDLSCG